VPEGAVRRGLVVALVAVAGPARADVTAVAPAAYIDVAHNFYDFTHEDGTLMEPPTDDDRKEIAEQRLELLSAEHEARGHCAVTWSEAGDDADRQALVTAWTSRVFTGVHASRLQLIRTVESLFPATTAEPWYADALILLHDLHMDQMDTAAQVDPVAYDPEPPDEPTTPPPCEAREVSDAIRYDQSYYAASAQRAMIESFPDDPRRDAALAELVELYADLDWRDALAWSLRELLCPGQNDAFDLQTDYGYGYAGSTIDYQACTPSEELDGPDLVNAWLMLADQEHTVAGRRTAEIAARERAASVPGVEPQLGVMWELAVAYLAAGQRVEAVPVLDELAEHAYADSTQIDLGDQAVTKIGETLAGLWRESSLPTPEAALKLAQIYFHQGRRKQPHVRAIFVALAHALRELGAYEQAASVQREVVTAWGLHPMAPQAAAALIEIELDRGDREAADDVRVSLIERFDAGTKWADANGADRAAVLVDDTRMALARSRYQIATQLAERKADDAATMLGVAQLYLADVVARSLSPAHVLEGQFLLGEIQVLLLDGAAAAASFAAVVDALPADAPLRDAAIGKLVRAREAALDQAIAAKTLVLPAVPTDFGKLGAPAEMPEVVASLHASYDLLLTILDRDDELAESLLSAAALDLRYAHLDVAEVSLRRIVTDHCFTGSARKARDLLVDLVRATDGAAAADEITKDVTARGCLDTAKALAARDKDLEQQLGKARTMIGKGDLLAAARLLDREYQNTPSTSTLVAEVLLEAAEAWIGAGDAAAAARLLDDLDTRPELATSPKLLDLRSTRAALAQRALDWPKAARHYLAAAAAAAATRKKKHEPAPREIAMLFSAAEVLAADHVWADHGNEPGAITLYLRVARKAVVGVANLAWMRAAELAQRAGRREQLTAIHTEWRKGKLDRDHGLVLERMEGQAAEAAGDRKGAETHYREVVTKGWAADNLGADALDAVVAARFWLGEEALRTDTVFEAFKWGKDQVDDEKRLGVIGDRIRALSETFTECATRSERWRVAAAVRIGDVVLAAIEAFVTTPPPQWLIEMMKQRGADKDTMTHAEGMRLLLENEYRQISSTMSEALAQPRIPGEERWVKLAEQRLAEIGSFVAVQGGARTEVFVEELRP